MSNVCTPILVDMATPVLEILILVLQSYNFNEVFVIRTHTHTHTHNALHFHNLMIPSRDALIINCCVKFCGLL